MEAGAARFYTGRVGRALRPGHRLKVLAAETFLAFACSDPLVLKTPACQNAWAMRKRMPMELNMVYDGRVFMIVICESVQDID